MPGSSSAPPGLSRFGGAATVARRLAERLRVGEREMGLHRNGQRTTVHL
jgi:hypothetical protein